MLDDEPLGLGSGLGKAFVCHLAALFDTPLQQEALVGFEQLQLVGLLQLLLPEQTSHMSPSVHSHRHTEWLLAGLNDYLFFYAFEFLLFRNTNRVVGLEKNDHIRLIIDFVEV